MSVNGVDNSRSGGGSESSAPQANGGMSDMFLTLLVAQIQNQDPTNPTDSADYINQLSMMSQMESMQTLTDTMTGVYYMGENLQMMAMASLVGQQVYVSSNQVQLSDTPLSGRLQLAHPAENVTLHVKDSSGNTVTLPLGKQAQGDVPFTLDPQALGLSEGEYTLSVVTDTGETAVPVEIAGTVNSVRFDASTGAPLLSIPGLGEVAYNTLRQFGHRDAAGTTPRAVAGASSPRFLF